MRLARFDGMNETYPEWAFEIRISNTGKNWLKAISRFSQCHWGWKEGEGGWQAWTEHLEKYDFHRRLLEDWMINGEYKLEWNVKRLSRGAQWNWKRSSALFAHCQIYLSKYFSRKLIQRNDYSNSETVVAPPSHIIPLACLSIGNRQTGEYPQIADYSTNINVDFWISLRNSSTNRIHAEHIFPICARYKTNYRQIFRFNQ